MLVLYLRVIECFSAFGRFRSLPRESSFDLLTRQKHASNAGRPDARRRRAGADDRDGMAANIVRTRVVRELLDGLHREIDERMGSAENETVRRSEEFRQAIKAYKSATQLPTQLHGLRPIEPSSLYSSLSFTAQDEGTPPTKKLPREYEGRSAMRLKQSMLAWETEPDPPNVIKARQKWALQQAEAQEQRQSAARVREQSAAVLHRYRLLQERVSSQGLHTVAWGDEETALFEALVDGEHDVAERSALLRSALLAVGCRNANKADAAAAAVGESTSEASDGPDGGTVGAVQWGKNERALLHAASAGDDTQVEELLKDGANPNGARADGQTPLLKAAAWGHAMVVQQLLAAGAVVDQTNRCGCSSMMLAAQNGHATVLSMLVDAGADPMLRGTGGPYLNLTACDIASQRGDADCATLLREATFVMRLVRRTQQREQQQHEQHEQHEQQDEDEKEEDEQQEEDGQRKEDGQQEEDEQQEEEKEEEHIPPPTWEDTADGQLYAKVTEICAAGAKTVEDAAQLEDAIGVLLDSRADPNVTAPHLLGYNGLTVLMRASACGQLGIATLLLAADGCEVNRQTKSGTTAAMLAAGAGQTSVLKLLIEESADVSLRMTSGPDAGKSALDFAVQEGQIGSEMLLRVAPDPVKMAEADGEAQASKAAEDKRLAIEMFDVWMQQSLA
eukprot:COSAG02_NODE_4809_length_4953_cov_118.497031_2_plen_676_part_00